MTKQHMLSPERVASRRLRRELRAVLDDFVLTAGPDDQEFLLNVVEDALDLRGTGDESALGSIETAFHQNLRRRSRVRFVRVRPEQLAEVLGFIQWRSGHGDRSKGYAEAKLDHSVASRPHVLPS